MFPYDITFLMQVILIILVCCCRPILADCSCCPIFSFLCNVCGSFVAVDQFKLIVRVARSLVFCVMFVDRWFSVIRFAASDYLLGNLSLWLLFRECHALCIYFFCSILLLPTTCQGESMMARWESKCHPHIQCLSFYLWPVAI